LRLYPPSFLAQHGAGNLQAAPSLVDSAAVDAHDFVSHGLASRARKARGLRQRERFDRIDQDGEAGGARIQSRKKPDDASRGWSAIESYQEPSYVRRCGASNQHRARRGGRYAPRNATGKQPPERAMSSPAERYDIGGHASRFAQNRGSRRLVRLHYV